MLYGWASGEWRGRGVWGDVWFVDNCYKIHFSVNFFLFVWHILCEIELLLA